MKHILKNRLMPAMLVSAIAASMAAVPVSAEFTAPQPDNGAVGEISNGGEWSIYNSQVGYIRNSSDISDNSDAGTVEVTGSAGISAAFKFDLSTKDTNEAASGKVIKSAKLRLTPMVSKSNLVQRLYTIDNEFTTTEGKKLTAEFSVPRTTKDDFFSDEAVTALSAEGLSEYPQALSDWQTAVDITGEVISAGDALSLLIEYGSGNMNKTEYAASNIAANNRLNGGSVPLLYSDGETEYSKWVYPQIVFEYTDSEVYKKAYEDFLSADAELVGKKVTEEEPITLSTLPNGSTVTFEMYDDTVSSPIMSEGSSLVYNDQYVGDASTANVIFTVTQTDGEETASYSRVIEVEADYTRSNIISFSAERDPLGVLSVESDGTVYTEGTAYAKTGSVFTVDGGANIGYTANITVKDTDDNVIEQNADGTYTMPGSDVSVSVEYTKKTFGTSRTAAVNSISLRSNGSTQGNGSDIIIAADRMTFVKFDLSGYDEGLISEAALQFTKNKGNSNTKAIFFVPNNEWDEQSFSGDFCLDGTEDTRLSAFKQDDGTTVVLYGDENRKTLIVPGSNEGSDEDLSAAAEGILGEYYLSSSGTSKSDSLDVTEAVKTAIAKSEDKVITLMVYSVGTTGGDYRSVTNAETLAARPSLTITESSAGMADEDLVTEINTVEDLERFAEIVNGGNSYEGKIVTLNNDLDLSDKYNAESGLSWEPIGSYDVIGGTNPFGGVFDGGEHTVSGLYINGSGSTQGLFGTVTGTIQDLTVSGDINAGSVVGGIAGWCSGSISNCSSSVDITAQREAGGIVGTVNSGSISDSDNSGSILITQKESYAGGIAGHSVDSVVSGCSNTGKVENGTDGFRNRLGGVAGYLENGEITGCDNSGDVQSSAVTASYTADRSQNYVGGIVGYSSYGSIGDCDNSGSVYNAVDYAGGIAGYLQSGDEVSGCTNTGAVEGADYVGGIIGYIGSGDISDCRNDGKVTGEGDAVGGVVGYLSVGSVYNCSYDETLNSGLELAGYNSAGTITSSGEPEPIVYSIEYVDGAAAVSAAEPGTYTVIFAAYDADDVLISMDIQAAEFTEAGEKTVSPQDIDTEGAETIKVMLWDSISGMRSFCKADTN